MIYGKEQKIETAKRLKELRENYNNGKGISHEKLAEVLNQRYGDQEKDKRNDYLGSLKEGMISVGVLKNYEVADFDHSKFNAGYGMNVSYLTMFADFYEVSNDYLLGLTKEKTIKIEIQAVSKMLGLTEKAITNLISINGTPLQEPKDILNEILESKMFNELVCDIVLSLGHYINKKQIGTTLLDTSFDFQLWLANRTGEKLIDEVVESYYLKTKDDIKPHIPGLRIDRKE